MTEHLGYEKHDSGGGGSGNVRNGSRAKTVLADNTGHVEIDVPRDRAGTFEPAIGVSLDGGETSSGYGSAAVVRAQNAGAEC